MYKIIFCDLDGTLLKDDKTLPEENAKAISYALSKGVKFVLCSGRSNMSLDVLNEQLGLVKENRISNGHGRALIPLDKEQQFELAERIIDEGLSVRQIEELVKEIQNPQPEEEKKTEKTVAPNPELARACVEIAKDLKSIFGTKVTIKNGKKKGKIEIEYYSPDELDRIVGLMKKNM